MTSRRLRFPVALIACAIGFWCMTASDAKAFEVSPVIVDLDVAPGGSAQGSIHITNNAESRQTYYISAQNFVAQGEEGQQDFLPETNQNDLAVWMTPQARSVTLEPDENMDFTYAVRVPNNAEPGGHYAALFFSTRPQADVGGSSVEMGAKTGILFLMKVPGDIREDARVETFRVSGGDRIDRLPAYLELRIRNLGNVHFRPEGTIIVKNIFGSVSAEIPVNPKNSAVLPNSIRRVESVWAKTFDIPQGGFFTEIKNEWNNFAIGRYTAEINATYGASKQPLPGRVVFWVFPWRLLIVALAAVVALFLLLMGYNRMVANAALKKAAKKR
jgi:hypothetical protein